MHFLNCIPKDLREDFKLKLILEGVIEYAI